MFTKASKAAERVGAQLTLSRRGFFSSLGKTAAVVAGAMGALLASGSKAHGVSLKCYCTYDGAASCILKANCLLLGGRCTGDC
jgi:hypothetical protein